MNFRITEALFLICWIISLAPINAPAVDVCDRPREILKKIYGEDDFKLEIQGALNSQLSEFSAFGIGTAYCNELLLDLESKFPNKVNSLTLTISEIIQRSIDFQSFRLKTYLSSGVSPKRYFGFLDELGDTGIYETILREVIIEGVQSANDFAAAKALHSRISEKEVVVTFLAEGGAPS